ncbi:Stage V sporulation protein K [Camellia lanceoleosa]|uniref:Stage V sporulation protein K n=1 Tax=Camellia lanceoleosa TaxID=1840588 RepID=A0ACC0HXB5_9ERIC|nr:Stage V sporulation protein K [Camellia lanceoleosa]
MAMFVYSYSYTEDMPTLEGVKKEISKIVGLSEIKSQLNEIVLKIEANERRCSLGYRRRPPKLFHMVFLGNSGTGKSTVARIVAQLFYLAESLPSYHVIELQGSSNSSQCIEDAKGGILLVNVCEDKLKHEVLEEIVLAMGEGETAVIFTGQQKEINRCMWSNKELHKRFSISLQFNDLTCEELAMILKAKMNDDRSEEDNPMCGLKLHPSCSVDMVGKLIAEQTSEKLRGKMNAYLVDPILVAAKNHLEDRVKDGAGESESDEKNTITMQDLKAGICYAFCGFNKLFGLQ